MSDRKRETRRRQYATRSGSKALKLIVESRVAQQLGAGVPLVREALIDRDLMRASLADWKVETLDQWFLDEAD